MAFRAVVYRFG